jgi:hypothetical protein
MTDEQVQDSNAEAEAAEADNAGDDEDVEPDYLDPLEEFAAEAAGDRERIKAVAEQAKATLEEHKAKLQTLRLRCSWPTWRS